jgi:triosephosphate isomerase
MSIPLIVGNWKMNGLATSLAEAQSLAVALAETPAKARTVLAPPSALIERMSRLLAGGSVAVGAQDCHPLAAGAHTGELAAEMLADAGATLVILGHSERRAGRSESDADVAAKVRAALRAGLEPIICVGETLAERQAGEAEAVVARQIAGSLPVELAGKPFAVAYEPVWAIGSGLTPTLAEIEAVHRAVRAAMVAALGESGRTAPILYGGSVKPGNAAEILAVPEVGGALVGGASLKADDFLPIVRAGG